MKKVAIAIEINNNAGRGVLGGILKYISGQGQWHIKLMSYPETMTAATIRSAKSNGFDGIIVNHAGDAAMARELRKVPLPVSAVDVSNPTIRKRRTKIAFADHQNREVGELGARKFLSLGKFRSFAFVAHPDKPDWSEERRRGFSQELQKHGIAPLVLREADFLVRLRELPRPVALMAAWDYKAVEVMESCREAGLRIPEDIAVIGVDADPLLCGFTNPPLTSIAPDFERLGYLAAAALDAMMSGRKLDRANHVVCRPKGVVERESTRFLPPAEALLRRAQEIIARDAPKGLTARDLALRLGVSQQLLALRFRQFEKKSVRERIIEAKLDHVREMLQRTDRNFAAVARNCGFNSVNRLAHLFKERCGESLGEYARRYSRPRKPNAKSNASATDRPSATA